MGCFICCSTGLSVPPGVYSRKIKMEGNKRKKEKVTLLGRKNLKVNETQKCWELCRIHLQIHLSQTFSPVNQD